mmetsp:Transcript_26276/g.66698  ORF Transcript_26276/g.66698 Transcript_26276/m.66698 type:complete len:311 (+) Transcript_26276:608-1540(+)
MPEGSDGSAGRASNGVLTAGGIGRMCVDGVLAADGMPRAVRATAVAVIPCASFCGSSSLEAVPKVRCTGWGREGGSGGCCCGGCCRAWLGCACGRCCPQLTPMDSCCGGGEGERTNVGGGAETQGRTEMSARCHSADWPAVSSNRSCHVSSTGASAGGGSSPAGNRSKISRVSWCTRSSHCQWKARTVRSATAWRTAVEREGPVYMEKQLVESRHQRRSSCSSAPSCTAEAGSSAGRRCIQPSWRRIVCARQLVGPLPSPVAGRARRPFWPRPCVFACASVAGRAGTERPSAGLSPREAAPTMEPAAIEP